MGVCPQLVFTIPNEGCKVGGGQTEAVQIFWDHSGGRATNSFLSSSVVLDRVRGSSSVSTSCIANTGRYPGITS